MGGGAGGAVTVMVKGPSAALVVPLAAVMVMLAVAPMSAVVGVPLKVPVLVSKVAQAGALVIEKVTAGVVGVTVGAKL